MGYVIYVWSASHACIGTWNFWCRRVVDCCCSNKIFTCDFLALVYDGQTEGLYKQSPPKDPQQIAIENAQSFLSKPDAVMEPDAPINLLTLAQASDAQTATIGVVMLQDRGYD